MGQQQQQQHQGGLGGQVPERKMSSSTSSNRSWDGECPSPGDPNITHPAFCTDHFRMYEFKVKACPRTRAHDWTQCPFAHPGEKARRRDPREYNYSAVPCPDYRKGTCKRGDSCEYAHGVFECWLHPSRYRTQMCTDGPACQRPVCFFAHHQGELRLPTEASPAAGAPQRCQPIPVAHQQQHPPRQHQRVQQHQPLAEASPPAVGGMEKLASDQLFSLALAHLLALQQNQQQGQQQLSTSAPPPGMPFHQGFHQHHAAAAMAAAQPQPHHKHFPPQHHHQMDNHVLEHSVPYYPRQMQVIKQGFTSQNHHPLSPSSPLQAEFAATNVMLKRDHGLGSMDNLLSSLPRSLSDVGLADAAFQM